MLVDRTGGELARQTGRSTPGGHDYNLIGDCASNVAAFIGIGTGPAPALGALGPLFGLLAGVGALF